MPIIDKEKSTAAYAFLARPALPNENSKEQKLIAHQCYVKLHGDIEGVEQELANVVREYQTAQTVLNKYLAQNASLIAQPLTLTHKAEIWLSQHPELINPLDQEQKLVAAVNKNDIKIKKALFCVEYWQKVLVEYAAKKPSANFNSIALPLTVQIKENSLLQGHLDAMIQINTALTAHVASFKKVIDKHALLINQLEANRGIVEKKISVPLTEAPCSVSPTLSAMSAATALIVPIMRGGNSPDSFTTAKVY